MDWKGVRKSYAHHRNLLSRGHTEIGLVYSSVQMGILVWLFLRDVTTFSRLWLFALLPGIVLLALAIQYGVGWLMDRHKVIDDLQKWDMSRNPQVMEILRQINDKKSDS